MWTALWSYSLLAGTQRHKHSVACCVSRLLLSWHCRCWAHYFSLRPRRLDALEVLLAVRVSSAYTSRHERHKTYVTASENMLAIANRAGSIIQLHKFTFCAWDASSAMVGHSEKRLWVINIENAYLNVLLQHQHHRRGRFIEPRRSYRSNQAASVLFMSPKTEKHFCSFLCQSIREASATASLFRCLKRDKLRVELSRLLPSAQLQNNLTSKKAFDAFDVREICADTLHSHVCVMHFVVESLKLIKAIVCSCVESHYRLHHRVPLWVFKAPDELLMKIQRGNSEWCQRIAEVVSFLFRFKHWTCTTAEWDSSLMKSFLLRSSLVSRKSSTRSH